MGPVYNQVLNIEDNHDAGAQQVKLSRSTTAKVSNSRPRGQIWPSKNIQ